MSHPTTRTDLRSRIRLAHIQLEVFLSTISETRATQPGAEGEWSVKEVLAHLVAWEARMTRQIQAAAEQQAIRIPLCSRDEAEDVDQLNALIVARYQAIPLAQIRAELKQTAQDLLGTLEEFTEATLFHPDGLARWLNHPALDYIAGDSYEHIEEHLTSLQRWRDR